MTCQQCQYSTTNPHWGGYSMRCVQCCARLIRSARPLKHAQDALLAAIAQRPENPARPAILQALKGLDASSVKP
jgi:hypothetical protein